MIASPTNLIIILLRYKKYSVSPTAKIEAVTIPKVLYLSTSKLINVHIEYIIVKYAVTINVLPDIWWNFSFDAYFNSN